MLLDYYINNIMNAYESYNMDKREAVENKVVKAFKQLFEESKEEVETLINAFSYKFNYEDLIKILDESLSTTEFKEKVAINKLDNGFVSAIINTSVGVVYYEACDELSTFKAILECMKNRNAIVVVRFEENEYDFINYLIMLFHKTLESMELDSNLIVSLPYEECDKSICDVAFSNYYEKKIERIKPKSEEMIILALDKEFKDEAEADFNKFVSNNSKVQFVEGTIEDNKKLLLSSRFKAIAVYTSKSEEAYRAINELHSDNVLINSSLDFAKKFEEVDNFYLQRKHIMYQLL